MIRKLRRLILLAATPLLFLAVLTQTAATPPAARPMAQTEIACTPDLVDRVESTEVTIRLGNNQTVKGEFFTPKPATGSFAPMAGIGITTGFASTYDNEGSSIASAESIAADLSAKCFVMMAYNWRGHGPVDPNLRPFFFHDEAVRTDLVLITDVLRNHLAPGEPDLVNDAYLGMLGFSQAGNVIWQMMAHQSTRGLFTVMVPWDGIMPSEEWMTPNDCILAALGNHVDLRNKRDAGETDGVTWDATAWSDLSVPYLANPPNLTTLRTTLDDRDGLDELADPYGGTPYPHTYAQTSEFDVGLSAGEIRAGHDILSPDSGSGVFPYHRLLVSPDAGHNDEAWAGTMSMRADRRNSRIGWLITHLPPSETPEPDPTPTPQAVEVFVDYYDPNGATDPPPLLYYKQGGASWPPSGATDLSLYFNADGELTEAAPTLTDASDNIGQTFDGSAYNATAAVAETPHYAAWDTHITGLDTQTYVSPILAQDIVLVTPPEAILYTDLVTGAAYQVHVRLLEELSSGPTGFVTRVNACRWGDIAINGTPLTGIERVHEFQEGSRLIVTLSPVDQEEYFRSRQELAFMPVFDSFDVNVLRQQNSPSRIVLEVVKSETGDIFEPGTLQGQAAPAVAVPGTPVPTPAPQPLALETLVWPEHTNPGNWHAWAPEVWFDCTGGEGQVSCPATAYLTTDGVNQSFTFTATDAVSNTVSVTLDGFNIDRTAPVLAESLPESQTFCSGATLTLDYDVSDALSGLDSSSATFNDLPVSDGTVVNLLAGGNTLRVEAGDVAGNALYRDVVVQVDYDETLAFPPDGGSVNPLLPLTFEFKVNDACAAQGYYANATGTLWLTGPDGEEIPAEWYGLPTGNTFTYNALTGWYAFDADLTGLSSGTWTARAHLDDGNDYTVAFVIPGGLGGETAEGTATTPTQPLHCDTARLSSLIDLRRCR